MSYRFVSSGTKFGHCRRDCRVFRCHSCSTQPRGLQLVARGTAFRASTSSPQGGTSSGTAIYSVHNSNQLNRTRHLPGALKLTKMAGHTKAAAQILAKMQSAPGTRLQPWKAACQLTLRCRPIAGDFISTESTAIPFRKSFHTFPYPRAWLHALHDNR